MVETRMNLKNGGKTEWLTKKKKIESIKVYEENGSICLDINDDSLSYLSFDEAAELTQELVRAMLDHTIVRAK
jgi:hypothetical protein